MELETTCTPKPLLQTAQVNPRCKWLVSIDFSYHTPKCCNKTAHKINHKKVPIKTFQKLQLKTLPLFIASKYLLAAKAPIGNSNKLSMKSLLDIHSI